MTTLALTQVANGSPISTDDVFINTTRYLNTVRDVQCDVSSVSRPASNLPASYDLNALTTIPYANITQGPVNICSSMAFANAYTLKTALTQPQKKPYLSPLYAYYFQRIRECETSSSTICACPTTKTCDPPCQDCGSLISSAIEIFSAGVCSAEAWPYTSPLNATPSSAAIADAVNHKITKTACTSDISVSSVKAALFRKDPVVVLLLLTPNQLSWMSANMQSVAKSVEEVTLPAQDLNGSQVGHVVLLTGWTPSGFVVRNNFGSGWGFKGQFLIPFISFNSKQVYKCVEIQAIV